MSTLELPTPVYQSLLDAAREIGATPAEWILSRLPQSRVGQSPTSAEIADANAQLRAHRIPQGDKE